MPKKANSDEDISGGYSYKDAEPITYRDSLEWIERLNQAAALHKRSRQEYMRIQIRAAIRRDERTPIPYVLEEGE